MSLLSQFFPGGSGGVNAAGNFNSALNSSLDTFPIDILLVGGGGGGGIVPSTKTSLPSPACFGMMDPNAALGGGGGGGRVIQMLGAVIATGTPYPITIGAGGAAGANGGATCFGNSLVAGGGGGGGTPGTFGRGQYELNTTSETAGSWGADTIYSNPSCMRITSATPSWPYFSSVASNPLSDFIATGRRLIPCNNFTDTTTPITYYDCVSSPILRQIQAAPTYGPSPFCYSPLANGLSGSNCSTDMAGAVFGPSTCYYEAKNFQTYWSGSATTPGDPISLGNAIFKKINHPACNCSFFGLGGTRSYAIGYTCPIQPLYTNCCSFGGVVCGVVTGDYCGFYGSWNSLVSFYQEGALNGCFPNVAYNTSPYGPSSVFGFYTGKLYDPLGYLAPCTSPGVVGQSLTNTISGSLRAAKGARAQFCPVSNTNIRTAILLSDYYSLVDHGPGLVNGPQCIVYASGVTPNFGGPIRNGYPSYYEIGCCNPFYQIPGVFNTPSFGTPLWASRACITPSSFGILQANSTVRGFTPDVTTVGILTGTLDPGFLTPFFNIVCAPVAPVIDCACWSAAQNGTAGWGGGGGGGINVSGIATAVTFRYQWYGAGPCYAPQAVPAGVCIDRYSTSLPAIAACPMVCYLRYVPPSPAAVATGGSGGSGAVYIVYPTDYPAATVTGNTAIPSPPAYRVYYWTGNGSITFNK